jgi:hypothetical protein
MASVTDYHIVFSGGPEGGQPCAAGIDPGPCVQQLACVRFSNPDKPFIPGHGSGGTIRMHLPSAILASVLEVLRNDSPVQVYFIQDGGFLGTATLELVGGRAG